MKFEDVITKLKSLVDKNTSDISTQTARIDKLSTTEVRKVRVNSASSMPSYTEITAAVPSGYSFLCWLGVSSVNFIGSPYIVDLTAQTSRIYDVNGLIEDGFYYDAYYLIYKTV